MAAFKHLSKQARCWLEQTNNILYVLLAHSDSYPISHLSQASTLYQSAPDWKRFLTQLKDASP